jgi:hypothetical protein
MTELITLAWILLTAVAFATPIILLIKLLAGPEGIAMHDLVAGPEPARWPRGVQETEPIHFRLAALSTPNAITG